MKEKGAHGMTAQTIRKELASVFTDMTDFAFRDMVFGEKTVTVAYLVGFCSRIFVNKYILEPISYAYTAGNASFPLESIITNIKVEKITEMDGAIRAILSGNAFVFSDTMENILGISVFTKNDEGRSTMEPETENVIRGPHEGFTESAENNVVLLRRRIHSAKLKRRSFVVGKETMTDVSVVFMEGIANGEVISEICRRISEIKTDAILDSGYVEIFLQDGKAPFYPTIGNSERPDKVAAKLMEGRVAILVDGSPVVLTAPYLFCEAFQVTEDYSKSPWYATFVRLLRFAAYLVSLYFPALFVAAFVRHPDRMPDFMLSAIQGARESLEFSLFWEVLIIFLIFETVREVGLRMPKAVGSAVGLVGSLILGDSAIKAGLTSAPVLVVVALAAVCNFMVPPYMNGNMLYRLLMIVISGALGFFGFFAAILVSCIVLCGKTSVGIPYLSPFAPFDREGMKDFLYMAPIWAMKRIPASLTGKRLIRTQGKIPEKGVKTGK
jgi:spore germination protein KA